MNAAETRADPAEQAAAMLMQTNLEPHDRAMALEGLSALLAALRDETGLTPAGRGGAFNRLRGRIAALDQVAADRRLHPAIAAVEIRRPLFITGLPRSGTTILHSILAQDPDTRSPLSWELARPSPPPVAATFETDPRIEAWISDNLSPGAESGRADPEFRKKHLTGAQLPEECGHIMGATLRGTEMWARCRVASYVSWWLGVSHSWDYEIHRRWLQHLQWRNPRQRWALKWPSHIFRLPALYEVYPDACVVQLHRDPREVVSSLSSLISTIRAPAFDSVDAAALGREMLAFWATGVERAAAFRRETPGPKVADVSYRQLLVEPLEAVRAIYASFEIPLTEEADARMRAFVRGAPQHAHGEHRHALSDYALTAGAVRERMAGYIKDYGAWL